MSWFPAVSPGEGIDRSIPRLVAMASAAVALFAASPIVRASEAQQPTPRQEGGRIEILVDVDAQKLRLIQGGLVVSSYPISTSRFGLGDAYRSYKTPVGTFRISDKLGSDLPIGAVLKGGRFTGEILPVNAPGRDPIVTRMIRLQGLEPQNRNTHDRGIFIHGTPEEKNLGKPVSWGCIRMRSRDVAELYGRVEVGTKVIISSRTGSIPPAEKKSTILSWFSGKG